MSLSCFSANPTPECVITGYDFQTAPAPAPLFSPHEMLMSFKKEFLEV